MKHAQNSRTPRECVDWNVVKAFIAVLISASRTPRECVDWNSYGGRWLQEHVMSHSSWVRGLKWNTGAIKKSSSESHSSWVRGLKCNGHIHIRCVTVCRTPRECVDWNSDERKQPFFITSHTSWVRGLKSHHKSERSWWRWSHSLWVRGLKLAYFIRQLQLFWFTWEHNLLLDYVPVCNAFVLFYYTLQNK